MQYPRICTANIFILIDVCTIINTMAHIKYIGHFKFIKCYKLTSFDRVATSASTQSGQSKSPQKRNFMLVFGNQEFVSHFRPNSSIEFLKVLHMNSQHNTEWY